MQPDLHEIDRIITTALKEDIGKGDITSELVVPSDVQSKMIFITREDIIVCGLSIMAHLFDKMEHNVKWDKLKKEGESVKSGEAIFMIEGNARAILMAERTALNLLQHMCGIATLTNRYVEAISGTRAKILDTRKTLPCLRELAKYAVHIGGGGNHRMRLDDGILIKDNHIHMVGGIKKAVIAAKNGIKGKMKVEVECDNLIQVEEAIKAKADIILLDNMSISELEAAVNLADGTVLLEASGGVTLKTVREIAETGVDYISVGAITHSAISVDIGLDAV